MAVHISSDWGQNLKSMIMFLHFWWDQIREMEIRIASKYMVAQSIEIHSKLSVSKKLFTIQLIGSTKLG